MENRVRDKLGVDDYIGKPPVLEILVKRIEKALDRAKRFRRGNTHAFVTARVAIEKFWSDDSFQEELGVKSDVLRAALGDVEQEVLHEVVGQHERSLGGLVLEIAGQGSILMPHLRRDLRDSLHQFLLPDAQARFDFRKVFH